VRVDLIGTPLEARSFRPVAENIHSTGFPQGDRWLNCHVKDGVWHRAGDETKLPAILQAFLAWAADPARPAGSSDSSE
jgi:hypothetical protein